MLGGLRRRTKRRILDGRVVSPERLRAALAGSLDTPE
jgi:hypothetical protein